MEQKVDTGFADVKSAIEDLKKAMASPPPPPSPPPAPSGGNEVHAGLRRSPLSFADAVSPGVQQPAGQDVTTPN